MSGHDDFLYEQYRLGELPPAERRKLEADPAFEARMAEMDRSDAEILASFPPSEMAASIREKADESGSAKILTFPGSRFVIPLTAAAALMLALFLGIQDRSPMSVTGDVTETVRIKGASRPDRISRPEMILYRNSAAGVEVLNNGDRAVEHDLIQVGFKGGGGWWGAILSVDGNGVVTRHWPVEGDRAVPLGNSTEELLPYSYELDDAPVYEAFVLIWAETAFPLEDAEAILREYDGEAGALKTDILSPGGKTGLSVIKVLKAP